MALSNKILKEWGQEGFIPGPDESEEDFLKRISFLKSLKKSQKSILQGHFEELGLSPNWIPLVYSNRKLAPWQGGALWLFKNREGIIVPTIQLKKQFKKGHFLFYSQEELLLHEAVHAVRLSFNEPQFEEILAYYHSKKKWRRFLGPLFRKPVEALFFLILILISFLAQGTTLFFPDSPFLPFLKVISFLPFADLLFRFAKLIRDNRILRKALKKLKQLFPNQKDPFPIVLRLKDLEIQKLATMPLEDLLSEIKTILPSSLRWQQILAQFS